MVNNIKLNVLAVLSVVALSLALVAPTHAVEPEDVGGDVPASLETPGEEDGGKTLNVAGVGEDGEGEDGEDGEGEDGEDGEGEDGEGNDGAKAVADDLSNDVKKVVSTDDDSVASTKAVLIVPRFLVKFVEVGESFTITDENADDFEISSGMPLGPVSVLRTADANELKSSTQDISAGVTVTKGEGGVFTITATGVGNFSVFLTKGGAISTSIMINSVQFTDTDDPTLSEIIDNFKTAMKTIEEAMNSGDNEAMQAAFEAYSEAMKADSKKFYGLYGYADEEFDKMLALMQVMAKLINGDDLAVEQYTYEYTEEDFEYIYEYDEGYATMLDQLYDMLEDLGYTENISVYNIDLGVYDAGAEPDEDGEVYPFAWLNTLTSERMVVVEVEGAPEDGYERQFVAVRAHLEGYEKNEDGEFIFGDDGYPIPIWSYAVLENVDFDPETRLVSLWSDQFSTFAIAYEDVLIPLTPETGMFTNEATSASTSSSTLVVAVIAVIMMAGLVKFAKRK